MSLLVIRPVTPHGPHRRSRGSLGLARPSRGHRHLRPRLGHGHRRRSSCRPATGSRSMPRSRPSTRLSPPSERPWRSRPELIERGCRAPSTPCPVTRPKSSRTEPTPSPSTSMSASTTAPWHTPSRWRAGWTPWRSASRRSSARCERARGGPGPPGGESPTPCSAAAPVAQAGPLGDRHRPAQRLARPDGSRAGRAGPRRHLRPARSRGGRRGHEWPPGSDRQPLRCRRPDDRQSHAGSGRAARGLNGWHRTPLAPTSRRFSRTTTSSSPAPVRSVT